MEMPAGFSPHFRHTVRLCATMLIAASRAAGIAGCREGNHPATDGEAVEVMLGWPFTSAQQQQPTSIRLSVEEARHIVAALKAALRSLSAAARDATTLDVSALALWSSITNNSSSSSSSKRSAICRRGSVHVETTAMREVVKAYTAGGGVWPGTGPSVFRPSTAGHNDPQLQRILQYLQDSGESGRVVFRTLVGDPRGVMMLESETTSSCSSSSSSSSSFPAAGTKRLMCTQSASSPSPRLGEASMPISNTIMAELKSKPATTTSKVDLLCVRGRESSTNSSFAKAKAKKGPADECDSERCYLPQVAVMSSESNKENEGPCECDRSRIRNRNRPRDDGGVAAAAATRSLAEPKPVERPSSSRTGQPLPRTDTAAASTEADSSSAVRCRYRSPEQSSAKTVVCSGKEEEEEEQESSAVSARAAANSQGEKSAAVPPSPNTGSRTPSSTSTADDAVKSERPFPIIVCEGAAAAPGSSSDPSSPAEASRGRHRQPSSPRGRPSSPLRAGNSSSTSPSRRSSGSPVPSSPRAGGHSSETEANETVEGSVFRSPPPPDRQRSCYYGLPGLTGSMFGGGIGPGAFWNSGNAHCSTNSSYSSLHAAVNGMVSCSKESLAQAERGTPPGVSSSSSSSSSSPSAHEQATTTAAAAATDEMIRKKARRVSWCPMVIAREEAAAYIRPRVERYIEAEEAEYRAEYTEFATGKFVRRPVEERAERKRGGAPAAATCRPVAQRGAFFGLLAGLYRPELMGWKLGPPDPYIALVSAISAGNLSPEAFIAWRDGGSVGGVSSPPGRVTNLGDLVRTTAANMGRRGQCRA